MALWKEVPGYEGRYLISDEGTVYSLPKVVFNGKREYMRDGRILKPGLRCRKPLLYAFVVLSDWEKTESKSIHRLVAEAFVPNPHPDKYVAVNHKDRNTLNNHAHNLEWCTQQYNNEYGHNRAVVQLLQDGTVVAKYKSITYASKITKIGRTAINNSLGNWSKTAGGYYWRYATEGSEDLSH